MQTKLAIALLLALPFVFCKEKKSVQQSSSASAKQAMRPPTKLVDVPFSDFTVNAAAGDTLAFENSIVFFPPNAFVDKDGKLITGNVQVRYRELNDPIDFYLSGAPMNYDSAGQQFSFESIGMYELLAFQDGQPVFVNPGSKPEITSLEMEGAEGNVYFFDSTKGNWVFKGVDEKIRIADLVDSSESEGPKLTSGEGIPTLPARPYKANANMPLIRLVIDPSSFEELKLYNNLRFQVDISKQPFDTADSKTEWNTVELERGKDAGTYIIKLSNTKKSVQYYARPVLEDKDYDNAMIIYNKKMEEYKRIKEKRLLTEKVVAEKSRKRFVADSIESARIQKALALMEARNREIRQENAMMKAHNNAIGMLRTFQLDGFGVWNIDKLFLQNTSPLTAVFQDSLGRELKLENIAVIEKNTNGIWRFADNNIRMVLFTENMIIGTYNEQIAYVSFKEFGKYKPRPGATQVYRVKLFPENEHNYLQMKSIMLR